MSYRLNFKVNKPDQLIMEMTLVMPLSNWRKLKVLMETSDKAMNEPFYGLTRDIRSMIDAVEKEHWANDVPLDPERDVKS